MPYKSNLAGQRFGRLVVLEEVESDKPGTWWLCKCDCDNTKVVQGTSLNAGRIKSCGCLKDETVKITHTKHGQNTLEGQTPTYRCWANILKRCDNPNDSRYHNYGGRGIKVCDRWKGEHGFENFLADMGSKPEGKTIDRINNDGDYEPGNCRWITNLEQQWNRRAKGYTWNKREQKYVASIGVNHKTIHLGRFDSPEEAQEAYLEAKKKYHTIKGEDHADVDD